MQQHVRTQLEWGLEDQRDEKKMELELPFTLVLRFVWP